MSKDTKKDAVEPQRTSRRADLIAANEDIPMPDIYSEDAPSEEIIRDFPVDPVDPVDDESLEIDTSEGFNPYDTGSLYRKPR